MLPDLTICKKCPHHKIGKGLFSGDKIIHRCIINGKLGEYVFDFYTVRKECPYLTEQTVSQGIQKQQL